MMTAAKGIATAELMITLKKSFKAVCDGQIVGGQ